MKGKLGAFSIILFFIGLMSYLVSILFANGIFFISGVIASVIGFIAALFAEKGGLKKSGLGGNGAIIFITVVFPYLVRTLYWTGP
ncbi:hypothetical protein [Gracilibacillus massiliensis]|uniref:hypothetical protein n=1 Tax=Gracilibacillus massiliensis TaxID=1564956 RepID=UPI00071E2D9A|nr:hypothetical protein [Gracilibacillus massiliensis]